MGKAELTRDTLREAALQYVARRETTRGHLREVLRRRVRNHAAKHGGQLPEAESWIGEILDSLESGQLIDDRRYAQLRASSLSRGGKSRRAIQAALHAKGVSSEDAAASLAAWAEQAPGAEWEALQQHARRRAIGPYRRGPDDFATRAKEQRALMRAGFDHALIRRLLAGVD